MSIQLENGARAQIEIDLDNISPEKNKEMQENARRALARMKQIEEAKARPESKTFPEPSEEQQKSETSKENNIMNLFASKRIAAIISILLCVVLYVSFLSVFTTQRDTYICYTTKTGENFHSATCRYLETAYETTVYEASQKYKTCKYCNPCDEKYETTIQVRDYITPIFISVPISVAIFFLIFLRKSKRI